MRCPCSHCMYLFYTGPRPLDVFLKAMPYRLFMGVVFMLCVWWANVVRGPGQEFFPIHFYVTILFMYAVHQVLQFVIDCFFHVYPNHCDIQYIANVMVVTVNYKSLFQSFLGWERRDGTCVWNALLGSQAKM